MSPASKKVFFWCRTCGIHTYGTRNDQGVLICDDCHTPDPTFVPRAVTKSPDSTFFWCRRCGQFTYGTPNSNGVLVCNHCHTVNSLPAGNQVLEASRLA
jgi:hypothetical protein